MFKTHYESAVEVVGPLLHAHGLSHDGSGMEGSRCLEEPEGTHGSEGGRPNGAVRDKEDGGVGADKEQRGGEHQFPLRDKEAHLGRLCLRRKQIRGNRFARLHQRSDDAVHDAVR